MLIITCIDALNPFEIWLVSVFKWDLKGVLVLVTSYGYYSQILYELSCSWIKEWLFFLSDEFLCDLVGIFVLEELVTKGILFQQGLLQQSYRFEN